VPERAVVASVRRSGSLSREELTDIGEGLELQSVARRVEKKHRSLLANLALEANVRLDYETDTCAAETVGQLLPFFHRKHNAKMRNWNIVAINGIMMAIPLARGWLQMSDDLVTKEIEVDPLRGTAAFRTSQCRPIELTSGFEIVDGKCDVKGRQWHVFLDLLNSFTLLVP